MLLENKQSVVCGMKCWANNPVLNILPIICSSVHIYKWVKNENSSIASIRSDDTKKQLKIHKYSYKPLNND